MKLVANHLIYLAADKLVEPGAVFEVAADAGKKLVESGAARGFSSTDDVEPSEKGADDKGDKKPPAK